jgi:2'-5' RNA ligase
MSEQTVRSFIAIELSEEIRKDLKKLIGELKHSEADVKWVEPDNIHLTLKFLGRISAEQIEKIKRLLEGISKEVRPFQISLSNLGAFPKLNYPRVIWIGIEEGKDKLCEINEELEERLEKTGFPKESRKYQPHLTLGRVRSTKNKERLIKQIELLMLETQRSCPIYGAKTKMEVAKITLFKSTLTPQGPIYSSLFEVTLSHTS